MQWAWAADLHRVERSGFSDRDEGITAAAGVAAAVERIGCGVSAAASLDRMGCGRAPLLCWPDGMVRADAAVTVLALGGASWPRLGSDAGWIEYLPGAVAAFQPANCGFQVDWSEHFRARFAGRPLKRLAVRFGQESVRGETMITRNGLEGGVIYALSGRLRDAIRDEGAATIHLDLRPDLSLAVLQDRLGGPRRSQSLANTLRKQAGSGAGSDRPGSGGAAQWCRAGQPACVDKGAGGAPCDAGPDRASDFLGRGRAGRGAGRVADAARSPRCVRRR